MSRFRFQAVTLLTILFSVIAPSAYGHGGHGGGGHGGFGHGGFGYGGYHGFGYGYHGYHGFGYYGYGYRGFGFGYPGFGYYGYPGFGGWGWGLYGLGGLGYGLYGLGGLGYGAYGYGGLGLGGLGFRGFGYGGYGGFSSTGNCCCLNAYPLYGGSVPVPAYNGGYTPAYDGSTPLPMPRGVSSSSRYVDYYARNTKPVTPSATASNVSATRYVDYYSRTTRPVAENKALLHVSVPADAELWLNGKRMSRTGTERDFITPQLNEGETYAYQIKALWTQDGRPQEATIEVKVRANKTTNVRLGTSSLAKR